MAFRSVASAAILNTFRVSDNEKPRQSKVATKNSVTLLIASAFVLAVSKLRAGLDDTRNPYLPLVTSCASM